KVIGDIRDGARGVLFLFGVSIVITALLVWNYAGRWKLAAAPVVCSLVAVVWQLGALTALGYGIDPFSILVPFLVFAIGVSHGVRRGVLSFHHEFPPPANHASVLGPPALLRRRGGGRGGAEGPFLAPSGKGQAPGAVASNYPHLLRAGSLGLLESGGSAHRRH